MTEMDPVEVMIAFSDDDDVVGQRADETRKRVFARLVKVANNFPGARSASVVDGTGVTVIIAANETLIHRNPMDWGSARRVTYPPSVPGTAAKKAAEALQTFLAALIVDQATLIVRQSAEIHVQIERLTSDLRDALDDNHQLQRELDAANIEIAFLKRTIDLLNDSIRTERPSIVRRVLLVVGTVLLAAATGAAEAGTSAIIEGDQSPSLGWSEQCDLIVNMLDDRVWDGDQFPRPPAP